MAPESVNIDINAAVNMLSTLCTRAFPSDNLRHGQSQADAHHYAPKGYTYISSVRLPRLTLRQIDEAERWEDVGQCTSGGCAHKFEDDAEVAGDQRHHHGADH
jgi:hypothetical protein